MLILVLAIVFSLIFSACCYMPINDKANEHICWWKFLFGWLGAYKAMFYLADLRIEFSALYGVATELDGITNGCPNLTSERNWKLQPVAAKFSQKLSFLLLLLLLL